MQDLPRPITNAASANMLLNISLLILCVAVALFIYSNIIIDQFVVQLFLVFNSIFVLYLVFSSRYSVKYSVVIKTFVVMLLIPVVPHLLINLIFSSRPLLIYPIEWRESSHASSIEAASYAIPLLFVNIYLVFVRFLKPAVIKLRGEESVLFVLYTSQCIIYSIFSTIGHDASLVSGDYAVSEVGNFLSINSWGAASTITLIFSGLTLNKNSRTQKFFFAVALVMSVFVTSFLYGKRADVFGLFLVIIALASIRRLKISMALVFIILSFAIFYLLSLLAVLRDYGISSSGLIDSLVTNEAMITQMLSDGYIIPSLTDFFSTMPMVLTYVKWDSRDLYFGMTYLHALSAIPPEILFPFRLQDSATTFLQKNYIFFNGGMFLPAEIYFNFGIFGVIILAILFSKVSSRLQLVVGATEQNPVMVKLNNAIVLAIVDGFSRFVLYGTSNFTKHIILIGIIVTFTHCAQYFFRKKGHR